MNGKRKISLVILGAGGRGTIYASLVKRSLFNEAEVVAVAEPRDFFRERLAAEHGIPEDRAFRDWHDVVKRPRFADAVVITTQDRMHLEPAVEFAKKGYHILIEKPIATDVESCAKVVEAVKKYKVMLSACHVMRYANYTKMLIELIRGGSVGTIVSIQHLEPVGHWRFAHSYVRGNWSREETSSSILLAKSIHDLDWLEYIAGKRCERISSFGSLMFFRPENRPAEAAGRCLDCTLAAKCPYCAQTFYLGRLRSGALDNYLESVTGAPTEESLLDALRKGPYGRCVFACDNNVADHQTVSMEFEGGATAVFTLAGCSKYGERKTRIFGSEGEIHCDGEKIAVHSYLHNVTHEIGIAPDTGDMLTHHNGGDLNCLKAFLDAIISNDPELIVSGADVSLETHLMVFAAERSRLEKRMINMSEMRSSTIYL